MPTELLVVNAEVCRPLRAAVLRPDRPPTDSVYEGDDDVRTLHLCVMAGTRVVGAATLLYDPLGGFKWRIRGMAVDAGHRRRGYGRQMLATLQAVVEKRGGGIWCNARETAAPFYAALGFAPERRGDPAANGSVRMSWRPAFEPAPEVDEDLDDEAAEAPPPATGARSARGAVASPAPSDV